MTKAGPLRWRTGAGWLVLSGDGRHGTRDSDAIDTAILAWATPDRPNAIILAAGGSSAYGEDLLEHWADMGGADGYIVPIYTATDAHRMHNCRLLAEAGLIYLGDGPDVLSLLHALQDSPSLDAIALAFADGAPVVAAGAASVAMGAWVANSASDSTGERGWEWLPGVIVASHYAGAERAQHLRRLLRTHSGCLGLGIPCGTALALGPGGRVETLGAGQATVVLSQHPTR